MIEAGPTDEPGATVKRPGRAGETIGRVVDLSFILVFVAALCHVTAFFLVAGYLPDPFFQDITATYTDWYNPAFWLYQEGTYSDWQSVYPPLTFVFIRLFSNPACYDESAEVARLCDPMGYQILWAFFLLNLILVYFSYRKIDRRTAVPRALAASAGLPMLFALERGNVIVPCFTFMVLAYGPLLKQSWLRWVCVALTINFKPYLLVALAGRAVKHQWRWLEGAGVATLGFYALGYALLGKGTPMELIKDIAGFTEKPFVLSFYILDYPSTYDSFLDIFRTPFPLMQFMGSQPIELMELIFPLLIKAGELGVAACFLGAFLRPGAVPGHRIIALIVSLLLTASESGGGYASGFLLFFVFLEPWKGGGRIVALLSAYLLCVPWDLQIVRIAHEIGGSFLSGRTVSHDLGLTLGAFIRPGLLLLIQYALVAISLTEILRAGPSWITSRRLRVGPALAQTPSGYTPVI